MSRTAPAAPRAGTVAELLAFWAHQTPDAPALLALDHAPVTYAGLMAAVTARVSVLRRCGIAPRDRVALLLPTSLDATIALLATMTAATAVPLNPDAPTAELVRTAHGVAAIVARDSDERRADRIGAATGSRRISVSSRVDCDRHGDQKDHGREHHALARQPPARAGETALILSTSGTTGDASRVPLSQDQMLAASAAFGRAVRLTSADCCLNLGQLFHVLHVANILPMLQVGGSAVIVPTGQPAAILAALQRFPISWTVAVPTVYQAVLEEAEGMRFPDQPASLRFLASAGSALPEELARSIESRLGAPVLNLYGMTEAQYMALSPSPPGRRKPGGVGRSLCGSLQIVDEDGRRVAAGVVGEIVTGGPHVFAGYLDDAEANAVAFLPGGGFRTGDLGYLDEDGVLFLTGRVKEMINRGGEKIAPADVEAALLAHPAVDEAAAFPLPDARLGEEVVAAVVPKPGIATTERQIRRETAKLLAPHKVPRRVWIVGDLPRTASGKLRRGELTRRFGRASNVSGSGEIPRFPEDYPSSCSARAAMSDT